MTGTNLIKRDRQEAVVTLLDFLEEIGSCQATGDQLLICHTKKGEVVQISTSLDRKNRVNVRKD
jgi:hypothetical protein